MTPADLMSAGTLAARAGSTSPVAALLLVFELVDEEPVSRVSDPQALRDRAVATVPMANSAGRRRVIRASMWGTGGASVTVDPRSVLRTALQPSRDEHLIIARRRRPRTCFREVSSAPPHIHS